MTVLKIINLGKSYTKKDKKNKQKEANFAKLPTRIIKHELEERYCEVCGNEQVASVIKSILSFANIVITIG